MATPDSPSAPETTLPSLSASEASGVIDALDRHRTKILLLIALLALAIGAYLVWTQIAQQKHLAAASAYSAALAKGEIAAFDAVTVDYPGSLPAGNALLSKASLQLKQGKAEDAKATFETFLSDYASHPRFAQALFGIAGIYEASGDRAKAKEYYEKTIATQSDAELTPLARIRLGDLALAAGSTDEARKNYTDSYTIHTGNPFFVYAEEKTALLAMKERPIVPRPKPPVVEAPAPAPAPAATETPAAPGNTAPATPAPAPTTPSTEAPAPATPEAATAPATPAPAPVAPSAEAPTPAPATPAPATPAPQP